MKENLLLSAIRRSGRMPAALRGKSSGSEPFFFKISREPISGGFVLETVNSEGKEVSPDYRYFSGAQASVLKQIDLIRSAATATFSWSGSNMEIILGDHPALVYLLMQCDNLVGKDGQKISVCDEIFTVELHILKMNSSYLPVPALNPDSQNPGMYFDLVSESFAYCSDDVIRRVEPLGQDFKLLSSFRMPFEDDFLLTYLSLYASSFAHHRIYVDGCEVESSAKEVLTQPTVFFEKVDEDGALYMRVGCTLPGAVENILSDFRPSYMAERSVEGGIVLRPISYSNENEAVGEIRKCLLKSAKDKAAQKEIYQDEEGFIVPPDTAANFLWAMLPSLISRFRILGTNNLSNYKYTTPEPRLTVKLSSGIDFLEGDASVEIGGDSFTLKDFVAMYERNRYIELSSLDKAIIDEDYVKKLRRLLGRSNSKGKLKLTFFDLPEVEALLADQGNLPEFKHHRQVYEGFNALHEASVPDIRINGALRPYQAEGLKWIKYLADNNLGGCLADDMGLGKTIQTISMLSTLYPGEKLPSLIVMPKSLLFNWKNELERFAPQLKVYSYYGPDRDDKQIAKCNVCLTSYAVVRNDLEILSKKKFCYIILDESQNIKNMVSQTTRGIYLLKGKHRLALSGTPVENNLSELYSLFRFLNPAMFGSIEQFNADYAIPVQKNGDKEAIRSLRSKISPFILRRLKQDVLTDLPDRTDQVIYVEMEPAHKEYYESRRRYYKSMIDSAISTEGVEKSQFLMFQAFNELRQIASIPEAVTDGRIQSEKVATLIERIEELVISGHKVAVFFNYLAGIELVGSALEQSGVKYVTMTGSTNDREAVVRRFQDNASCKVMLMTLKTGGVGLNLTTADTAFIFEPWWNKAAEEQAIGRLHRIGQLSKVMSFQMIALGTIEEKILELQQKKKDLVDALISSDRSMSKFLSQEDIDFILG